MFDFANSGYTTVVLTAIFNSYFVGVVAAEYENGTATLLWSIATAIANAFVLCSAPIVGAIADYSACKKRYLLFCTVGCVISTAMLALAGPGDVVLAMVLVIISSLLFFSGENLISAFLPELTTPEKMGRISAYGWTLGYFGGLLVLLLCLVYVKYAEAAGQTAEQFVPGTMLIVAAMFALASLPTFIWLKERAVKQQNKAANVSYIRIGFNRLKHTFSHARQYRDLFRFLITLTVYQCGIITVIVLAAIYAQEVMGFSTQDTIFLILIVNITAALGAFVFGHIQDRIGAIKTLVMVLLIWISAMVYAFFVETRSEFWIVANLIGLALGSSQSAGRAIVGMFSPKQRAGEFFGLWGLATKVAAIIGPLVYGLITHLTGGDHKSALLSTTAFFIVGLIMLIGIDTQRGIAAAHGAD
jgi:UMF1 family MFS transporter